MLKFKLNQEYQCLLKKQSLIFAQDRAWDSVRSVFRLEGDSSSFEQYLIKDGVPDAGAELAALEANPLEQPVWKLLDALPDIRNQILDTDAIQLSGLKYTLYPDGTFKVEYDFNQPDAQMEQRGLDSSPILTHSPAIHTLATLDEGMAQQLDALLQPDTATDEPQFLQSCLEALEAKNKQATHDWGLGRESGCDVDLTLGIITFDIGHDIVARDIQVVGSLNPVTHHFTWATAHPAVAPELQDAVQQVETYAAQHHYDSLLQPALKYSEEDAWRLAAVTCHVSQAQGAYRAFVDGEWLYVVFFADDE